jgi:hypothetical protein
MMPLLRFLRRHPLAVLGTLALAFVAWLWRDAIAPPAEQPAAGEVPQLAAPAPRRLPRPPDLPGEKLTPTQQVFSQLKPGMTRAEVEGLVGVPAPANIHPATVSDGRVTYSTSYEVDFAPPTVRPIPHHRLPVPPPPPGPRAVVTLQFDATKPGHPLVGIVYPNDRF